MKILIVDDGENDRILLSKMLASGHHELRLAKDGFEALAMISEEKPDLVISDVMMPRVDGFELLRRIKDDPEFAPISFVFSSSTFVDEEDRKIGLALGAFGFVVKPVEAKELFSLVDSVAAKKSDGFQVVEATAQAGDHAYNAEIERQLSDSALRKLYAKIEELEREKGALAESEARLKTLLAEKELLLREVHHRVNNSLQIILGILAFSQDLLDREFENSHGGESEPSEASRLLYATTLRIRAISRIYEEVYTAENATKVDMVDFIVGFCSELSSPSGFHTGTLEVKTDARGVRLELSRAIPCGLIMAEALTNSFIHAYPVGFEGKRQISVGAREEPGQFYELWVSNDGLPPKEGISIKTGANLGFWLVRNLTSQLGGVSTLKREGDRTDFRLRFPVRPY